MVVPHKTPVLIVGAGPAGLIASLQLSKQGIPCILVERNSETTKWPKMDTTNSRSMELFNRLGISNAIREVGVPPQYSGDVVFSSGLSEGEEICRWKLPSVNEARETIKRENDGTHPREPRQRCSQAIFEAWLRPHIEKQSLITCLFGMEFTALMEDEARVTSELVDESGKKHLVDSDYVIACDGAGSRVRKAIGNTLIGGPVPAAMYFCHFKSRDLDVLHCQGRFCRMFFTSGSSLLSMDEKETWTCHTQIPIGTDVTKLDPREMISKVLGGSGSPVKIKIDEIVNTSTWRPTICIADRYTSRHKRVFLSGDAAHQNIPTGGYGMNTAVADSFDLGWKLAAVLRGYGGPCLLDSYEIERRPVAQRAIERSGVHWTVHSTIWGWVRDSEVSILSDEALELKNRIRQHVSTHDGENRDNGIEFGYRYNDSIIICPDDDTTQPPPYLERSYVPSTWPGARPPHVFLGDGKTSIFDLFGQGPEFSIIDFTQDARYATLLAPVAEQLGIPLKAVCLPDEPHIRKIWERDAVLLRPDDHVSWRARADGDVSMVNAEEIMQVVTGNVKGHPESSAAVESATETLSMTGFTGTVGNVDQDNVEMRAVFQT